MNLNLGITIRSLSTLINVPVWLKVRWSNHLPLSLPVSSVEEVKNNWLDHK